LDDNFSNASLSIEFARCLMFDLIGSMLKSLDYDENSSFLEELNPIKRLTKCNSVDAMKQEIFLVLNSVYQYVQENVQNRKNQLHEKVLDYIQKNYMDVNLCIPMIAGEFGFSAAYLSKVFKDQTGTSIVDTINQVRLEKAKRYLTEKKMTIIETCKLVGYYNSNAMIRAFKKYEGITPGQYKELEAK
jgi:two-component system response regulator YesN